MEPITNGYLVGGLLRLAIAAFAAVTLLLQVAFYLHLSLTHFAMAFVLVAAVGLGVFGWWFPRTWRRQTDHSKRIFLALLVVAVLCGLTAAAINAPEEDDSLYVPLALQALERPDQPLTFAIQWVVPLSADAGLEAVLPSLSSGIAHFWAAISLITGADFLSLYSVVGSLLFGAAFPIVFFVLIVSSLNDENVALWGAMAVAIAGFIVFREHTAGYGALLTKIWIGKAVLAGLLIPAAAAFAISFFKSPSMLDWGSLALAGIASTGLSSSSLFLFPMLLLSLGAGYLVLGKLSEGHPLRERIVNVVIVGLAGSYPAATALYFRFTSGEVASIQRGATHLGAGRDFYTSSLEGFFGAPWSITSICTGMSLIYLAVRGGSNAWRLLGWFGAAAVLFATPVTYGVVAENLTSHIAYGRVFYLVPVFAVSGAAAGLFLAQWLQPTPGWVPPTVRKALAKGVGAFLLCLLLLDVFGANEVTRRLISSNPNKTDLIGSSTLAMPAVRLRPALEDDLRHLAQALKGSDVLATLDYAVAMPMITTEVRQFYLWPPSVMPVHGETLAEEGEAAVRQHAAEFLYGHVEYLDDFAALLDQGVDHVIASKRMNLDLQLIKAEVEDHGFVLVEDTERYSLYSRL